MTRQTGFMKIGEVNLDYAWVGPAPFEQPTIVLLHEGLGCVEAWRDFPEQLCEATGCGVLVYSRQGYGESDSVKLPRPASYMHDEAYDVLGKVLDHWNISKAILIGQSDGASIATIYAGGVIDHRVRALVLIAPHFIVEDVSLDGIEDAKEAFEEGDLREKLQRVHGSNVDCAFHGWADTWLRKGFAKEWDISDSLAYIRVPILIIQGENDNYGTWRQIEIAQETTYCPVEVAWLEGCGHAPHREMPERTVNEISAFVRRLLDDFGERDLVA